jgi:hypothetical protein
MHDRRRKGAGDFNVDTRAAGVVFVCCAVSALRRVLLERSFHGRGFSGASIAERYRGLLRGTVLVSGFSIALIAGLTVGAMPAAAQSGGNGGGNSGSCSGALGGDYGHQVHPAPPPS